MSDLFILLVCLFLCGYILPSIILSILQMNHINKELKKPAILLESDDYIQAGEYSIASLKLSIAQKILEGIMFVFWVSVGFTWLQGLSVEINNNHYIQSIAFVLSYIIISDIIQFPFAFYETFKLDKKYGFTHQTLGLFLSDTFKKLLITFVLGSLIAFLLIFIIEQFEHWWIVGFFTLLCVVILANLIYPTIIAPMFNKFTPLDDENLKARIESLMNKSGFKSNGIFVIDASRRDERLNAYFGGLGKSKRVVLFDTLLDKISSDGLIAILGHELGHFKHKDLLKNIGIMAFVLFILFFVVGHLPVALFDTLGIDYDGAGVLVTLILIAPIISFWFMPLIGYFSRRAEYAADEYGASLSSKHCLANALVRLVNENKSFPSSHPAYIFFYYTHPPLLQRLKALDYDI
ncbi:M48 family metallopeptidase [Helicobacter sp. MIT 05-5293]|uniref:M48 family metallopeptidase n=1 Tax=Helicobacter sp. MIT 05-5293 TaxID=1548149 RepID=UPI00051D7453|nr:M48 family metallopeptidase [Helicobacter sp. MIT 05-5293]